VISSDGRVGAVVPEGAWPLIVVFGNAVPGKEASGGQRAGALWNGIRAGGWITIRQMISTGLLAPQAIDITSPGILSAVPRESGLRQRLRRDRGFATESY
jgi:hypothetical protein